MASSTAMCGLSIKTTQTTRGLVAEPNVRNVYWGTPRMAEADDRPRTLYRTKNAGLAFPSGSAIVEDAAGIRPQK